MHVILCTFEEAWAARYPKGPFVNKQSAINNQPSAITHQQSEINHLQSPKSHEQSAKSHEQSAHLSVPWTR